MTIEEKISTQKPLYSGKTIQQICGMLGSNDIPRVRGALRFFGFTKNLIKKDGIAMAVWEAA